MSKRPLSITIIGWLLISYSIVLISLSIISMHNLIGTILIRRGPFPDLPVWVYLLIIFFSYILVVVSGIYILRGKKWARTLLTVLMGLIFIGGLLINPNKLSLLVPSIIWGGVLILLYTVKANTFFNSDY